MMTVDLGCGNYPRGDANYTLKGKAVCEATPHLDPYLSIYGFTYRKKVEPIEKDIMQVPISSYADANVLMCHVIEHLAYPYMMLHRIAEGKANLLVVVCPNARENLADREDEEHIFSFTQWSLAHLLKRHFSYVAVRLIMEGQDLIAVASDKVFPYFLMDDPSAMVKTVSIAE